MKVDVESVCETKVTTNDDNVGEGGEQKWRDIQNDMNCLQFIQIAQTPFSDIEKEILWIKKQAQNYVWKGQDQLCCQDMMVPKPNERKDIVLKMHMEIGHFGEH